MSPTIAGELTVSASDDPRFKAGDSIGIVLDSSVEITVTQNVEVSAPVAAAPAQAALPIADGTTPPAAAPGGTTADEPGAAPEVVTAATP
jgi:hypothetical protein